MNLESRYPKLFNALEDKEVELRHLLNVDENYDDYDSEEFDFDPQEYNFIIYIADPVTMLLGEAKMEELMVKLNDNKAFEYLTATEIDLYGVKTELDEDAIIALVLDQVEEIL